jgi:hypothetical protein
MSDYAGAGDTQAQAEAAEAEQADDEAAVSFSFPVPADWPPGLALAFSQMMEKALDEGFPIVVPVRDDARPEQIGQILEEVRTLVKNAGLAVPQA